MSHEPARVLLADGTEWYAEFNSSVPDACISGFPQLYPTRAALDAEWRRPWEARSVPHACTNACVLERAAYHVLGMVIDVIVCRAHRWIVEVPHTPDGDPAPGTDGWVPRRAS